MSTSECCCRVEISDCLRSDQPSTWGTVFAAITTAEGRGVLLLPVLERGGPDGL